MGFDRRMLFKGGVASLALTLSAKICADDLVDAETESEALESVFEEIDAFSESGVNELEQFSNRPTALSEDPITKSIQINSFTYPLPKVDDGFVAKIRARKYWRVPVNDRPAPSWTAMVKNTDYEHLKSYLAGFDPAKPFSLTHEALVFLADRNAFALGSSSKIVVFGLRGCALVDSKTHTDWGLSHQLKCVEPDHISPKCIIGLWNRANKRLRVFKASTVPEVGNMYASLAAGSGTSLLPTGLYNYEVGTHKAGKATRQPGALRNPNRYVVLRTTKDLNYDPDSAEDAWTLGMVHNIHAGGRGLANPRFDSAGCQVIPGFYDPERIIAGGPWADFRRSAGIVGADGVTVNSLANTDGKFKYMLLTGLEAAMSASPTSAFENTYKRLRPGSSGPRVTAAQQIIYDKQKSVFGSPTVVNGVFDTKMTFAALIHRKLNSDEKDFISPILKG